MRSTISQETQEGFTLVELLVVILIIGVLAAIAVPSFINQRSKANDSVAKSAVRVAQTAIETYRVEHGDYCGATPAGLVKIEPALAQATSLTVSACPGGAGDAYDISVTSASGFATVYDASAASGATSRTCNTPGQGGCLQGGTW